MGSISSKTRKLTVENEETPTSVIKVSDDVVDRIRGVSETASASLEADGSDDQDYWNNRQKHLEESHKEINMIMDYEYSKAINEFKSIQASPEALRELPCQDSKLAVLDCYRKNLDEPMNCARIVQAFQECVDHKRVCLLTANKSA